MCICIERCIYSDATRERERERKREPLERLLSEAAWANASAAAHCTSWFSDLAIAMSFCMTPGLSRISFPNSITPDAMLTEKETERQRDRERDTERDRDGERHIRTYTQTHRESKSERDVCVRATDR